ncbi:MAG: hypothetical protein J1F05_07250 [Muribaculaceae bacterium]|nr:hypothetical protein [Muribaculaceae bacterium]
MTKEIFLDIRLEASLYPDLWRLEHLLNKTALVGSQRSGFGLILLGVGNVVELCATTYNRHGAVGAYLVSRGADKRQLFNDVEAVDEIELTSRVKRERGKSWENIGF